jgi:hypothetical protein
MFVGDRKNNNQHYEKENKMHINIISLKDCAHNGDKTLDGFLYHNIYCKMGIEIPANVDA